MKIYKLRTPYISVFLLVVLVSCVNQKNEFSETVFTDDFSTHTTGSISPPVGPHTEYHFLKEAQPKGNWKITSFYHNPRGADTAWRVVDRQGKKTMNQSILNKFAFTHPMIVAGNILWKDYKVTLEFTPADAPLRSGLIFRYKNDRQYYFFGIQHNNIQLLRVNNESYYHIPDEIGLETKYSFHPESKKVYKLCVELKGAKIRAWIDGIRELNGNYSKFYLNEMFPAFFSPYCVTGTDSTFANGKIALMADGPSTFYSVKVETTKDEIIRIEKEEKATQAIETKLQESNPKLLFWKKISIAGFGVGRNLRFGDLNNDGTTDVLIGQVVHHAWPRDSYSELSCLTAMTFDGIKLWQIGKPSKDHESLTNDVAFQIYDLDNDGRNEVVYTMNCELIVADAATGKTKLKRPTPSLESVQYATDSKTEVIKKWDKILGDCLYFCDLRGKGRPTDIVIKDRYTRFWVLDEKLNIQWTASCRTGHYPYSKDINDDGKEELFVGYSAYNWKGKLLWSLDNDLEDHCDGIAVADFGDVKKTGYKVFIAASDQGAIVLDTLGQIQKRHLVGHVQNPSIANFRNDLPGLETVSVNFWGNQGIIHFYDSSHNIYHDFEPTQYGSMCLPINWNGKNEEFFVLNANVQEGGMYDGWGRKVVQFPDDGHPDMCNAVLDITGDVRDEVVVWDPNELWIYTQNDSPKQRKLYQTKRNPLYNYSNYQLTVSEPIQ